VPCSDIAGTINGGALVSGIRISVLGGVPDRAANVEALDQLYRDAAWRAHVSARQLALVARAEYRWPAIGAAVRVSVEDALETRNLGSAPRAPQLQEAAS